MSPSRLRGMLLAAVAATAAALLLAWSQPWYTVVLTDDAPSTEALSVGGDVAASGIAPLALTALALVAALAIAGPVFRRILGVLGALLGGSIIAVAFVTIGDPIAASAPVVTDATGISGAESVAELVASIEGTVWPWLAVVFGALVIVWGVAIALTAGRWPVSGRKYTRTRTVDATEAMTDPVSEWDALSEGDDPTAPDR